MVKGLFLVVTVFSMFRVSAGNHLGVTDETRVNADTIYSFDEFALNAYHQMNDPSLFYKPFKVALSGYYKALNQGKIKRKEVLTVVDFTKSSNQERLYIIDIVNWKVIRKSLVAHGVNTGNEFATSFSNLENSHQSSLGFYVTAEVYNGKHDKSLKLDGMEYTNSNSRKRGVVVHAANYVSKEFIKKHGRLGRSHGCPALPHENYDEIIELIKDGCGFFIYYPDQDYMKKSSFLSYARDLHISVSGRIIS